MKIEEAIKDKQEAARQAERCAAALSLFRGIETPLSMVHAFAWRDEVPVAVTLTPERDDEARALLIEVFRAVGARKAAKTFSEYSGKVQYTIATPGVQVVIKAVPPRCEVEAYEVVETTPAHTQVVKKFRLKNPAECLGQSGQEG
jgi:hypothetical protein